MTQVELLLTYQQEDSKLLKIEQEYSSSEQVKNYSKTKSFLLKAPEKLEILDNKARELKNKVDELNKKYAEISETLTDFENLDDLIDGGADISFYKKNISQIGDKLKGIKNEINSLSNAIKEADGDYKAFKNRVIETQKQHEANQEIYKQYRKVKLAEMNVVKTELDNLAKDIDEEVIRKYSEKRSERIFPIICKEVGGRCHCGSELSIADKDKLASGNVIECATCHRFVYKG